VFCSQKCAKLDPAFLAKQSARLSGAGNPSWKGGVGVPAVSASGRAYRRAPLHVEIEKWVRRKRALAQATPAWADLHAIRLFYLQAQYMTSVTGLSHHVDHIVPLNGGTVCGLHVQDNLQVLPARKNLQKHNRNWPDMP
jgi:hypothetical protein